MKRNEDLQKILNFDDKFNVRLNILQLKHLKF
jgi:hypothetical protein